jgi:hypothetical protein
LGRAFEVLEERGRVDTAILSIEGEPAQQRAPLAALQAFYWCGYEPLVASLWCRQKVERVASGKQLIGHDGQRKHVVRRMRFLAFEHLAACV